MIDEEIELSKSKATLLIEKLKERDKNKVPFRIDRQTIILVSKEKYKRLKKKGDKK